MNYKIGFWVALVSLVLVGMVLVIDISKNDPLLTKPDTTIGEFVDTTFSMATRSSDAIVMSFDVEAKLVDKRDLFEIQNTIYETSLTHNTLWFYKHVTGGTINDEIWLKNASITGMAFEQIFMDMIAEKDSLETVPVTTTIPVKVNKPTPIGGEPKIKNN